jgi:hypothetical protein
MNFEMKHHIAKMVLGSLTLWYNKVIRKVRQRQHRNPLFGHIGDEISKTRIIKVHWASTGHETQFSSKFGAELSLPSPFFSWTLSTNHCCCCVYCSYKCSRRLVLRLCISYPCLIKFHDCFSFIPLFNKIVQRKTFMITFDWLVTVIPALMFTWSFM